MQISNPQGRSAPLAGAARPASKPATEAQSQLRGAETRPALADGARIEGDSQVGAQLTATFREQFAAQAQDPEAFHALMSQVYGADYDASKAEGFRQQALAGDFSFLPPIELVSGEELQHGNAAYDAQSGVIYLNEALVGDPARAGEALVEEIGHHLDTQLKSSDSVGDEGELFRRLLGGESLSAAQIESIRSENDVRTITINGREVQVEFIFGKIAKGIGKAVKSVGKAVSNVGKKTVNAFKNVGKAFKDIPKAFTVEPGATPWESFKNGFKMPFKALGSVVKAAVSVPVAVLTPVFATAGEILKPVFNVAGKVLGPVLEPIGKALGPILGPVGQAAAKVLGPVFQAYDFVMAPFRDVLGPVFEPLGEGVRELTGHLPQPLSTIGGLAGDIVGDPATFVEIVLTGGVATVVRKGAAFALTRNLAKNGLRQATRAAAKEFGEQAIQKGLQKSAQKAAQQAARSTLDDGLRAASKGAREAYEKTLKEGLESATTKAAKKQAYKQAAKAKETYFRAAIQGAQESAQRAALEAAQETLEGGLRRAGRKVRFREPAIKPSDVRRGREFAKRQIDDIAKGGNATVRDRLARRLSEDALQNRTMRWLGRAQDTTTPVTSVAQHSRKFFKEIGLEAFENEANPD